jgi:hypothetical protein
MPEPLKHFVEGEWLSAVAGKALFYPAAGEDAVAFVDMFAPHVRRFHFNDLFYSTASDRAPCAPKRFRLVSAERPDPAVRDAPIAWPTPDSTPGRKLTPSVLLETLTDGETEIIVHRRRGFGEYALGEFGPASIGVFVHRSDSPAEGGSNMWFLANRRKDHEPLSNLWDKLSQRLADRAIIVSDGSLTDFRFIHRAKQFTELAAIPVTSFGGFEWRCIGVMADRGKALVWGLTRQ